MQSELFCDILWKIKKFRKVHIFRILSYCIRPEKIWEMPSDKICKTVHQYDKSPISGENMRKLQEIAEDCKAVKNHVQERFGEISALPKLYPGYIVQNEMTKTGLRERLKLPSVYVYLGCLTRWGISEDSGRGQKAKSRHWYRRTGILPWRRNIIFGLP